MVLYMLLQDSRLVFWVFGKTCRLRWYRETGNQDVLGFNAKARPHGQALFTCGQFCPHPNTELKLRS